MSDKTAPQVATDVVEDITDTEPTSQPISDTDIAAIAAEAEKIITEVNEHHQRMLIKAKIDLTRQFPFMGFITMSTKYIWTTMIPTMAATTIPMATILVNPVFLVKGLVNNKQRTFALAHEILHIFLEHIGRQIDSNYHPKLWNIATDFCINGYLAAIDSGSSDKLSVMEVPDWCLHDKKYYGMSSDAIYHQLLEENNNDIQKALSQFGEVDDNDDNDDGDDDGDDGDDGDASSGSGSGKKPGKGKKQRPMDNVSTEKVSESAKSENRQKIAAAVQNASNDDRRMGTGRGDLLRIFDDMLQPVIPWNQLLSDFITTSSAQRHTYSRISRRSNRIVFPTMTGDHVNIAIGIDTSGSMSSSDLGEAMSEVQSVVETFESWTLLLMSCDTQAHIIGTYSSEEGDSFGTIDKNLIGGGGTDMSPMAQYVTELDEYPSCCIIITDGYIPKVDGVSEEVPVLLVVTKSGNDNLVDDDCTVIKMNDF